MRFSSSLAVLAAAALFLSADSQATNTKTYPVNPYYSSGTMAGFRELYVDPEKYVQSVTPSEAVEGGGAERNAELHIYNDTIGWIKVSVNGQEIGILTPMVEGVISNIKAGQYDVTFEMANKFKTTYRLSTVPMETAPAEKAAPEPEPAQKREKPAREDQ